MKSILETTIFAGTVGALFSLMSVFGIFAQGDYDPSWGAWGTLQFMLMLSSVVALLSGIFFAVGCYVGRVSVSLLHAVVGALVVVVATHVSILYLGDGVLYRKYWYTTWLSLVVMSASVPLVLGSKQA